MTFALRSVGSCYNKSNMNTVTTIFTIIITVLVINNPRPVRPKASGNTGAATRISNGTAVYPPHKYPFMVELWWSGYSANTTEMYDPRHSCGASIVDKHWVMSAAHCFTNVRFLFPPTRPTVDTVLTGMHRAGRLEPWSQNITIKDIIAPSILYKRKGYFQRYHTQDIVLLRLSTPIIFSQYVTPVNLPPIDFEPLQDFKDNVTVIGWGDIWEGPPYNATPSDAVELREISIPLMTTETCQRRAGMFQYKNRYNESNTESFDVNEFMLCTGYSEQLPEVPIGTCYGDSGSPILLYNAKYDTYSQVGIVSTGHCWYDSPQLSTNVGKYVHWIKWTTRRCQWRNVSVYYPEDDV